MSSSIQLMWEDVGRHEQRVRTFRKSCCQMAAEGWIGSLPFIYFHLPCTFKLDESILAVWENFRSVLKRWHLKIGVRRSQRRGKKFTKRVSAAAAAAKPPIWRQNQTIVGAVRVCELWCYHGALYHVDIKIVPPPLPFPFSQKGVLCWEGETGYLLSRFT